jgi:hypothetical protein
VTAIEGLVGRAIGKGMHVQAVSNATHEAVRLKGLFDLAQAWCALLIEQRNIYHPEKHYMRGPGPKCREKQKLCGPAA